PDPQPRGAGEPGSRRTRVPAGADALATAREPDPYRGPKRSVYGAAEPSGGAGRTGSGRVGAAVARRRAEEVRSGRVYDYPGAAEPDQPDAGGIQPGNGKCRLR